MDTGENEPATKSDIVRLDGKIDGVEKSLGSRITGLAVELVKTNAKIDHMKDEIMTGLGDFRSELLKAFEDSVVKGKRYDNKALTHADQLQSHETRLGDHDKRIAVIESSRPT